MNTETATSRGHGQRLRILRYCDCPSCPAVSQVLRATPAGTRTGTRTIPLASIAGLRNVLSTSTSESNPDMIRHTVVASRASDGHDVVVSSWWTLLAACAAMVAPPGAVVVIIVRRDARRRARYLLARRWKAADLQYPWADGVNGTGRNIPSSLTERIVVAHEHQARLLSLGPPAGDETVPSPPHHGRVPHAELQLTTPQVTSTPADGVRMTRP